MSEFRGTPGPWRIGKQSSVHVTSGRDRGICSTGGYSDNHVNVTQENDANARLIAAAPDLLAALESIVVAADYDNRGNDLHIVRARSAIAKALGQ